MNVLTCLCGMGRGGGASGGGGEGGSKVWAVMGVRTTLSQKERR